MSEYQEADLHEMVVMYSKQNKLLNKELFHYLCDADSKRVAVVKS